MPDAALEDTELQFFELLDIASGDVPVLLKLYSLTGVPRTDRGQRHLEQLLLRHRRSLEQPVRRRDHDRHRAPAAPTYGMNPTGLL